MKKFRIKKLKALVFFLLFVTAFSSPATAAAISLYPAFATGAAGASGVSDEVYEAAYADAFEKVRTAIRADQSYITSANSLPSSDISEVSYIFHDIDKNGVKELLLRTLGDTCVIFTYSDGACIELAYWRGYRDCFLGVNELGYMYGGGSSGVYSGGMQYIKIADDGRSSVVVALIDYEIDEDNDNSILYNVMTPYYTRVLADDEIDDLFDLLDAADVKLENWKQLTDQTGHVSAPAAGWPQIKPDRPIAAGGGITAVSTTSTIYVDGRESPFDAFLIENNNYFKLRDLAYALSDSNKRFEVDWDGNANAISLLKGLPYTKTGFEFSGMAGRGVKTPVRTSAKILIDGVETAFTAYNIDGYNYFKLRDIGAAINFGVGWDAASNTITIDTAINYQ